METEGKKPAITYLRYILTGLGIWQIRRATYTYNQNKKSEFYIRQRIPAAMILQPIKYQQRVLKNGSWSTTKN